MKQKRIAVILHGYSGDSKGILPVKKILLYQSLTVLFWMPLENPT